MAQLSPKRSCAALPANNLKHPTYRALAELGKAVKTIFLCRYLESKALRQAIHEGLNVVENWNSADGFIFYGKGGKIATNRLEDQEIAVLSLHLLQAFLVYINTLMIHLQPRQAGMAPGSGPCADQAAGIAQLPVDVRTGEAVTALAESPRSRSRSQPDSCGRRRNVAMVNNNCVFSDSGCRL